jgi:predicted negative regulator of RcsB-dependent stress response
LNVEAYPRSWSAADALGNGYRDSNDTTRAIQAYTRALELVDPSNAAARSAIETKLAALRR